jgi:hypothetical protein
MAKVTDPDNLDRFQVCVDPIAESVSLRGLGTERHAVDQTGDSDGTTTFTDAGANFTSDGVIVGDILTIISDPANDGGIIGHYRVAGSIGTTTLDVERNIPASTGADLTYKINAKQTTGAVGEQVADGVNGQALFSFLKEEWITLAAGLGNAQDLNKFDFPIVAINIDQFILGGVNGDAASAWSFNDTNGVESTDVEGATRELLRDVGWQERASDNDVVREYPNYTTLGNLDSDAQATYQQGDATGDPANFKLTGPVNQAILAFGPDVGPDAVGAGFDIDNAAKTITRNDGGNWADDNYRVGDYITIRDAEDPANDGSYGPITVVDDSVDGDITIPSASWTTNADDTTVVIQVDHRRYTALRCRKKGRSYALALHANAGIPSAGIVPKVNNFPLAHANDPAIVDNAGVAHNYDGVVSGGDGTATGDIFQDNESLASASDGQTSAEAADGTFTFTSSTGGFQTQARGINILQPGDTLKITSGSDQGSFEIKTIDSDTVLTCYTEPTVTFTGSENTLDFTVYTGIRDIGATNATLADVDGDTGTLTSAGSTFGVDTAIGDRIVVAGDIVQVTAGTGAVIGYYKVVSQDSATQLTLNTSDQPFSGETNQTYMIWQPGMFLQRFESTAVGASMTNMDFDGAGDPDTMTRTGGSWTTDGFTAGMAITVVDAEDSENIGTYIIAGTPTATVVTLIAEESLTTNAADTTAINGNITGDTGITRSVNSVTYPFHWRLFSNGGNLSQIFQFIQREWRRATDIDGGNGTERGDVTDLLMTFASPNGVTLDLYPDDLATTELNNVTYTDISGDARTNAFIVGIIFDVNSNLIGSANNRLVAYFTTNPAGNFGSNTAVIVDDSGGSDMDFTSIAADINSSFDYTNNAQGGRTPDTDAAITVVAIGDDLAQHILTTATITKQNSLTIAVGNPLERNFLNP